MSDDLDSKSDAQLNEAFAVEVAGWRAIKNLGGAGGFLAIDPRGECYIDLGGTPGRAIALNAPNFCIHAEAVLPCLEKGTVSASRVDITDTPDAWRVTVPGATAFGSSFARASVIALLRAKRAEKGPQ